MRRLVLVSIVLLAGCEAGSPPTSAAEPAPVASTDVSTAGEPVVAAPEMPADDGPAPPDSATDVPTPPRPSRAQIGTFDDWIRDYIAASTPETFAPAALRKLPAAREDVPTSTLVFQRSGHLFQLDLPSGDERPLTTGAFFEGPPTWTDDGKELFFVSNRDGGKEHVYRMTFPGGEPRPVTRGLRGRAKWAVSRDGAKVVYAHDRDPDGVHMVDVATGAETIAPLDHVQYVAWTRDAKSVLAVHGWITEQAHLVSIDASTGKVRALPTPKVAEIGQPWDLGDGRMLVVTSADFSMMGRNPHFVTTSLDGGAFRWVGSFDMPIGYLSGEVSPDRRLLAAAWSQRQGGLGAAWHEDVSVIDLETGAVRAPRLSKMFPRPFYQAFDPTWAPDGRHLALTLAVCAKSDCQPHIRSVVLVDAERPNDVPIYLAEGGAAAFRPEGE